MELKLISPTKTETFSIAWIEINTPAGNFVIQSGHAPTILTLEPHQPITFCLDSGKKNSITVLRGVIEITRETATIIASDNG